MSTTYVSTSTAPLTHVGGRKTRKLELLWGDRVTILEDHGSYLKVRARGRTGRLKPSDVGGDPLLEVYIIDVGQGDGILIVTPDRRHIMIDGGYIRDRQPTGKNAADFVDWKFFRDYGEDTIRLDAMIASHCDSDHYGGLWDLLNKSPEAKRELDCQHLEVGAFYHAGVSWWRKQPKGRWLGPLNETKEYLTWLLGDRAHAQACLDADSEGPLLQGEWAKFIKAVVEKGCPMARLSSSDRYVPGFAPGESEATLRILAPIPFANPETGAPAVRAYGARASQNTNGHSLLLQLQLGNARILLTGDLNKRSMQAILGDIEKRELLQCDVAKGCHHGSDDVSYEFLQAMGASATIISSGDAEGHAHPRPRVVAASALTGHVRIKDDELQTPLVYSTEISRSVAIGRINRIYNDEFLIDGRPVPVAFQRSGSGAKLDYDVQMSGDLKPKKHTNSLSYRNRIVERVTYGLVNVRTDGKDILCATLNEKKDKWEFERFRSRF